MECKRLKMGMRERRYGRRGFTLIELVLVMSILGVLSAIAVPRFQRSIVKQRADAAARRVAEDLRYARKRAVQRSTTQSVAFTRSVAGDSYAIAGAAGLNDRAAAYRVALGSEPYYATLTSVSFGGKSTVVFDGYGIPDNGGAVVLRIGEFARTVTLDGATGQVVVTP